MLHENTRVKSNNDLVSVFLKHIPAVGRAIVNTFPVQAQLCKMSGEAAKAAFLLFRRRGGKEKVQTQLS